ncbi:hypothetical protein LTT66_31715 [Nocardia gipuzkoensis]|nr:hypothetical protein [Nocardia gipuzkoensis]UGT67717.1 hypothetical protein LTT66_31715 [Nocardia gipuzkoensis]
MRDRPLSFRDVSPAEFDRVGGREAVVDVQKIDNRVGLTGAASRSRHA